MKIENINEKRYSRFNEIVSHKINLTIHGLFVEHPPAWEFFFVIIEIYSKMIKLSANF